MALSILSDEGYLSALLERSHRSYLSFDAFLGMKLPTDANPNTLWSLLQLFNRRMGIPYPISDFEGRDYWYLRTHELADITAKIQCLCRPDSNLHRLLADVQNSSVVVKSRIAETIAAGQLDGLVLSPEAGSDLLHVGRVPRGDQERLIANTFSAMNSVETLIDEPFSEELFRHFESMLLHGVDEVALQSSKRSLGLMIEEADDEDARRYSHRQMKYIADYLNHETGDLYDPPVLRALLLPDLFQFYRPLPHVSTEVGRLTLRLYALKRELPVLGLLPLARARLKWEMDEGSYAGLSFGPDDYRRLRLFSGEDLTAHMTILAQLALATLEEVYAEIRELDKRDRELRNLLQRDQLINHRQRSILGRALRNPEAEFRIAYHKTTHNIVYATARADLMELVERGYFELKKDGRAHVFVPKPNLREMVEGGGEPSRS